MEKIVETLVSQHTELQVLLGEIEQKATCASDCAEIVTLHELFLKKLEGHLSLEDEFFYPKILEGMRRKNIASEQVDKTKLFINKMKDIEMQVVQFFDTYKTEESIQEKKEAYLRELKDIMTILIMRIETEEDSIYIMWDFFGEKESACV
jgi:regulator of sigma D